MKKTLLSLITLTFFLCEASFTGGGMAFAENFGTNLTYSISNNNTLTISVKSGYTTGTMPYWTSSTGRPWENSKTTITTVIINKGVKNIGSYAFYGFTALSTVKFGTSTTDTCSIDSVGTYAFYNCSKVATVYCYGSTATLAMHNWLNIGFNGFYANPFGQSKIKGSSKKFYMNSTNTTSLTTSNLSKATKIKPYAFYKHSQLTSVTLPSTVKSIGNYAFAYDSLLNTVKFGSGSTDQCGIDTIMGSAFATCVALATVYCYGGIEKWLHIGFNAGAANPLGAYTGSGTKKFYLDGTSITTLTIPEGVTKIKGYAFYKHSYLTKVSLPSTVSSVGGYAFAYCTGLTDFVALPAIPPSTTIYTFNNTTIVSVNLYVASAAAATAYGTADRWKDFATRSTTFEDECGASGDNITFVLNFADHSLTLTGSGAMATYSTSTKAPWYTFKDDIHTILIGSGITGIGAYAFKDCANVTSASIPASITSIGSSAFDGCKAMTSYSYVGTIAQWLGITFGGSSSNPMCNVKKCYANGSTEVNNLVIPDGITTIGNYAFYQCSGLTSVTLPASLTTVNNNAFATCTNITNTNFLGTIDQWCSISFNSTACNPAFFSKQLSINGIEQTDIYLSDELTEIKNYTFYDNAALTSISVKNTTTIRPNALTNCAADIVVRGELSADFGTGLHWSLLDGVLTISGEGAMPITYATGGAPWYPYRNSINKIIVEEGITRIGKYCFEKITNTCGVFLPESLTNIDNYAFYGSTGIAYIVSKNTTPPAIPAVQYGGQYSYASHTFYNVPTTSAIYVPSGSESDYASAVTTGHNTSDGWKRFSNFLPYTGTCGATGNEANVIWLFDPGTGALTISGTGAMADFANSTSMPWNNFKTSITSVVIESGVTNIGQYSFHGCTNLASLTIPSSVTSFKTITYNNCSSLTTVNYLGTANQWASCTFASGTANPMYASKSLQLNGVTLTTCTLSVPVNDYAFYEDEALQTLVLADGCTSVGEQSFYYCKNLKDVTISSDVAEFKSGAFTGCSALDKANEGSVNYLGSANQWASITFASYNSTPVYCAKSLKLNGTTLTNCTISVPVKERVFYNEKDLVSVTLDEGATSIASDTFYGCSALETISCAASANLASIGSSAFSGCSALADITLPASLQEVGSSAFNSCSALDADASVNFLGTLNQWASITFASKSCNPASLVHKLKINGDVVTACALSVPVKANTFADNTSLTSLTLGACCTTIGASAFEGCSNLAGTIAFPSTLTEIASQAFRSCTSISGLDFSQASSLTTLGSSAFYGCTSVAGDLYFPASVSSVGGNVFQNITGVTAIYANPTTAPTGPNQYTFNQIDKSIPFYVPSATAASSYAAAAYWQDFTNVSYYGYCGAEGNEENVMWAYNPSTHSLTISGTGAMADYELYGAPWNDFRTDIQHIVIEEDVTVIGRYAFYHCDNLKTVALPASLTEIKTGVFWYCNDMESYTYAGTLANWLAVNVGGTDSNPMRYTGKCIVNVDEEINDLVIPNGTTSIGKNAFYGCAGLESVTIPASLTSIGNVAFSNCSNIEEVNYLGTISQWCAIDFYSNQSNPAWLSKQLSINGVEQINIYLPDELSEIKDYVFGYNTKAETISVNSSTTIHTHAFDNCTADILYRGDAGGETADGLLWSLVDGLLTISGTGAMSDYSETETPWYPFRSIVTGIVVAEGVTAIGRNAFTKQASATSVLIASSVTSIGDWAFSECTSLTQITCNAETPPTILDGQDGPGSYSSRTFKDIPVDIVVMVPIGSTSAYQASRTDSHNTTSGWARFTNYHEPAVTDIDIIDSENNGVTLTTYNGQEMTVHLTRTIISDSYNTICLPFAMSEAQVESAFGAECDIEELTRASYADGNLKLFFTKRTAIEAGKPYLIQPQSDVANPTIAGVTIDNTARPSEFEGVTFTGIFSPTVLANSDNLLFVGSANTLYMSSGGQMKGMRGYFELTTPQAQAAAKRSARIILHEEAATGIDEVRSENANAVRSEKIMRNGQLFILRDGKTYNAQGALIK